MIAMLPFDELSRYMRNPTIIGKACAVRWALHDRFAAITPPLFIYSQEEVPGIEEMGSSPRQIKPKAAGRWGT
jgi:hypothetical protein